MASATPRKTKGKKRSLCKGRSKKQCYFPCVVVKRQDGSTYCRSKCSRKGKASRKGKSKGKGKKKAAKSATKKSAPGLFESIFSSSPEPEAEESNSETNESEPEEASSAKETTPESEESNIESAEPKPVEGESPPESAESKSEEKSKPEGDGEQAVTGGKKRKTPRRKRSKRRH